VEGRGKRVWCGNLFKKLQILRFISQYRITLLMFVVPEVKNVYFVPLMCLMTCHALGCIFKVT